MLKEYIPPSKLEKALKNPPSHECGAAKELKNPLAKVFNEVHELRDKCLPELTLARYLSDAAALLKPLSQRETGNKNTRSNAIILITGKKMHCTQKEP